jgi:hypothetical protein
MGKLLPHSANIVITLSSLIMSSAIVVAALVAVSRRFKERA